MANPVPAVIARSLEVFIEKLLTKSVDVTQQRLAKTLTPQHIKECVKLEPTFQFLHSVVAAVPDLGSEGGGGHSTITSGHQGSTDALVGASTGASTSHRGSGPKRRGSKHVSAESSTLSQDGPPPKTPRRGRAAKRSVELDHDFGDLSDTDEPSGEDSGEKVYRRKSSGKASSKQPQQRWRSQEEVYELGPSVADDVPDDPSTS